MKLIIQRRRIVIEPESEIDIAYIEEVLGLSSDKASIQLKRVNMNLGCIAYLEARPMSGEEAEEFPMRS
jgi:hypothetical protein